VFLERTYNLKGTRKI